MEMFDLFHNGQLNLSRLNYKLISLIPNLKEVSNIRQLQSLCLLGVDYQIFTKVLTRRLTSVVDLVISMTQTAFIPGMNILEGVVILHKTLYELYRRKEKGIIMKLDFEKAYDKVSWDFLLEVLKKKKFPDKWMD
jgi:hypothetical protein